MDHIIWEGSMSLLKDPSPLAYKTQHNPSNKLSLFHLQTRLESSLAKERCSFGGALDSISCRELVSSHMKIELGCYILEGTSQKSLLRQFMGFSNYRGLESP